VQESVDAMLARRRRRRHPRSTDSGGVLRVLRRLEFNRASSLPSPGERVPVGFITIGPVDAALGHLIHVLQLVGRVPVIQLGAVHPIDDVAVSRLLSRCERVVVLEPRPGVTEVGVLEIAEAMRQADQHPATVWGRFLPPDENGQQSQLMADDALHPSILARRALHLLHMIRPTAHIASQLLPERTTTDDAPPPRGLTVGPAAAVAVIRRLIADVDQWLRAQEPDEGEEEPYVPTALVIDGSMPVSVPPRLVRVEVWEPLRFQRLGTAALRHAAREDEPWIFIVCEAGADDGQDLERLARGVIPGESADRVRMETANFADEVRLVELLREAALAEGMTVIIVRDGPPARFDVASIERTLAEVDRLGFEPRQRRVWPVERTCAVREPIEDDQAEHRAQRDSPALRPELRFDRLPGRRSRQVRFRVRPLLEQVEVIRTRPPVRRWRRESAERLPLPEVIHGRASQWRVHLAGFRGEGPGLAARILGEAGRRMGYAVRCAHDPTPIGAGRRAWAQVLFTHPREGEAPAPLVARVPFGEADLLLGFDAVETLRAMRGDPALRVAAADRTYAVVNLGLFSDESDTEETRSIRVSLNDALRRETRVHPRLSEDFVDSCRAWFHTDRVADAALLGAAFQSGAIPVTLDAIESAVEMLQRASYGRIMEAFQFGRRLAVDRRLFTRPRDEREEDVSRIVRRSMHVLGRRRWRRVSQAARFGRLLTDSLAGMPGLRETDAGRQALRDFAIALNRCRLWGGPECAERYARLVTDLYHADRGETGRVLTRCAVLPLAALMLIRDPIYLASIATSAEQRRRIRQTLAVKRARDDELHRRYLTRFELLAFGQRYRADVRTSDWPARIMATARHIVPGRWRGTHRERELRRYLVELVERATAAADADYEAFQDSFHKLHQQALDDRLRGMALSELRMLAEPQLAADDDDAPAP
jgi:Pyruvate/2-oxoacid:ferredoxin oxidoreductase gamma subunit